MPGWPLLAASTASIASVRIVLIEVCSRLSAMVDMRRYCGRRCFRRTVRIQLVKKRIRSILMA